MSDWAINSAQKVIMPVSCSYQTWLSQGHCSLEYTGLQPLLNTDMTFRVSIQSCSSAGTFTLPSITIDCSGESCQLLGDPILCTSNSDCSGIPGAVCLDLASELAGQSLDPFEFLFNISNVFPNGTSCAGSSYFASDLGSFIQYILGLSTSTPLPQQFCFLDVVSLINRISNEEVFNLTQWANDQAIVNGDAISFKYIQNWVPASTSTTGTCQFTLTLNETTTIDTSSITVQITTILSQNGITGVTVSVTVTSNSVSVTITAADPSVTNNIASGLSNKSSQLSRQISEGLGGSVSGVQAGTKTTSSGGSVICWSVMAVFVAIVSVLVTSY